MEKDLIARLRHDADLAALVGVHASLSRPMIDWAARPEGGALPAIVITEITPGINYDQDQPTELESPRIQFTVIAATHRETVLVRAGLRAVLESGAAVGDTVFERGFLDGSRSLIAKDLPGGGKEFALAVDFIIWHRKLVS